MFDHSLLATPESAFAAHSQDSESNLPARATAEYDAESLLQLLQLLLTSDNDDSERDNGDDKAHFLLGNVEAPAAERDVPRDREQGDQTPHFLLSDVEAPANLLDVTSESDPSDQTTHFLLGGVDAPADLLALASSELAGNDNNAIDDADDSDGSSVQEQESEDGGDGPQDDAESIDSADDSADDGVTTADEPAPAPVASPKTPRTDAAASSPTATRASRPCAIFWDVENVGCPSGFSDGDKFVRLIESAVRSSVQGNVS